MRRWLDRLLLLLDLPMGGIAALTVLTDAGYHYPGYLIYVSAIYTFYMAALAAVNFVRFRRLGSPALSAAKAVNLASAVSPASWRNGSAAAAPTIRSRSSRSSYIAFPTHSELFVQGRRRLCTIFSLDTPLTCVVK